MATKSKKFEQSGWFRFLSGNKPRTVAFLLSCLFAGVFILETALLIYSGVDNENSKNYLKSESYKYDSAEMYERLCVTASAYLRNVDDDWNFTEKKHLLTDYLYYLDYNDYKYKKTDNGIVLISSMFDYYVSFNDGESVRYITNISYVKGTEDENERLDELKSDYKNYIMRRNNEVSSDMTSSGQIRDYYYNNADFLETCTEEFYADNLMPVGGSYHDSYGRNFYNYGNYDEIVFYDSDPSYNARTGLDLRAGIQYADRISDEDYYDGEYDEAYVFFDDYGNAWHSSVPIIYQDDYKAENNDDGGITVFMAPKTEKIAAMQDNYDKARSTVKQAKILMTILGCFELLFVCYMTVFCAYNPDPADERRWAVKSFLRKIPTEIYFLFMIIVFLTAGTIFACWRSFSKLFASLFESGLLEVFVRNALFITIFALLYALGFGSFVEIVGKIKTRCIFKDSLICKFVRFILRKFKETSFYHYMHGLPLGVKLTIRTVLIGLLMVFVEFTAYYILASQLVCFLIIMFLLILNIRDYTQLSKLSRQIDCLGEDEPYEGKIKKHSPVYAESQKLNSIHDKIKESVEQQIQSERLKIELVTNVSHDLKTPLTSIISYIDLLKKLDLDDEARSYVKIIDKKAQKLKGIVADVLSIAKATSGVDVNLDKLDFIMLLNQCIADAEDKINDSGKTVKINIVSDSAMVMGDGDKLYRVFQNLVDNALNYSMEGTRIFLDVYKNSDSVVFSAKNVSAEPINFTEDEIIERFVRGDKSRTDGGSGLGLSIAKSFTESCGGTFRIDIDGDMFKAIVTMPIIKDEPEDNDSPENENEEKE